MLANLPNWLDGGYFATGGAFFPLKHYWSLAVEEQFYIVYPLVFLLLLPKPIPKRRVGVLAAIAAGSIAICIFGEYRHPAVTFYLMPAGAWELMFGALAAECLPLRLNSRIATEGAAYGCLAVITSAFFIFDETKAFPNPFVLIPCAATALLLFIGRHRSTTAFQFLSIRPLVFTGRISYSLYLWHVPILAFVQYYAIRRLSDEALLAVSVAIYLTAVLSYLFIENPIRRRVALNSDRAFLLAALGACIVVGAAGACLWSSRGLTVAVWPRHTSSYTTGPAAAGCGAVYEFTAASRRRRWSVSIWARPRRSAKGRSMGRQSRARTVARVRGTGASEGHTD